jgi:hypothetical protein
MANQLMQMRVLVMKVETRIHEPSELAYCPAAMTARWFFDHDGLRGPWRGGLGLPHNHFAPSERSDWRKAAGSGTRRDGGHDTAVVGVATLGATGSLGALLAEVIEHLFLISDCAGDHGRWRIDVAPWATGPAR